MPDALPTAPDLTPMTLELFALRNVGHVLVRREGKWVRVLRPDTMADLQHLITAIRVEAVTDWMRGLAEALPKALFPEAHTNRDREIL